MNKKVALLVAVVVLGLLTGCVGGVKEEADRSQSVGNTTVEKIAGQMPGQGVYKFHDYRDDVTCYVYKDTMDQGGAGGISCIPMDEGDR